MRVSYRLCDRCGKRIEDEYWGDKYKDKNYPMYAMDIIFGLGSILYNGQWIHNTHLDLCDKCLGFFLNELKGDANVYSN